MYRRIFTIICLSILTFSVKAQVTLGGNDSASIDFASPKDYEIGGITVTGANHLDQNVLILLSGLTVGDKVQVPGDKFSTAIQNLWKQGLFEDVKITATKIQGKNIFINFEVLERPRLAKFALKGMTKSEADDLREKIKLIKGKVVTDGLIASTSSIVKDFFVNKAYLDTKVDIVKEKDEKIDNSVVLMIYVTKGKKIRIQDINIKGNASIETWKLRKKFKETKRRRWWNPFNSGKFDQDNYEKDKKALIQKYNEKGFRDAKIVHDSMYKVQSVKIKTNWKRSFNDFRIRKDTIRTTKRVSIDITVQEGMKYYFRNINWVGNSKYSTKDLSNVLGVKKGDVYDQATIDQKLFSNPNGNDISSLYMDDGYLFFNVSPVETNVTGDSIDLEMRVFEGKQATINKITVVGNTKTNDRVIMREIRTKPGQLFRRTDIIRTQRDLSQLGYFNPEKMNVVPTPNQATGTVDIEYTVEEKPSDQIELSGGYGNNQIVGTLGVVFNNFSAKNFFKKDAWRPLPSGDGQRLSVRAQSSGLLYQSYNMSYTEPWLGGKKPNSFSVTTYYSVQSNGQPLKVNDSDGNKIKNPARTNLNIAGVSVGLGTRVKWPDDYLTFYQELDYQ